MNTRKPIRLPLGDTEQMREQWGLWRMDGMGVPSYVSPAWALMRDATPSKSKEYPAGLGMIVGLVCGSGRVCREERTPDSVRPCRGTGAGAVPRAGGIGAGLGGCRPAQDRQLGSEGEGAAG